MAAAVIVKPTHRADTPLLGLREDWRQFWLLVLINAFVGTMVGLERTVLPLLAEQEFGVASRSAALSFIATFGIVKAITNLVAGRTAPTGRSHRAERVRRLPGCGSGGSSLWRDSGSLRPSP